MGGLCIKQGTDKNSYNILVGKKEKEREHSEDLGLLKRMRL